MAHILILGITILAIGVMTHNMILGIMSLVIWVTPPISSFGG